MIHLIRCLWVLFHLPREEPPPHPAHRVPPCWIDRMNFTTERPEQDDDDDLQAGRA